jgi:Methyltransferase domain
MQAYPQKFYSDRHEKTVHSAHAVLSVVLEHIPAIDSAVDVGCGVGTWLAVLREKGVSTVRGVDGNWVDRELLVIPKSSFSQIDLGSAMVKLPRRYDLAISLEVAEHLNSNRAAEFVTALTDLSDLVLFSAAIPSQGGANHVNEQWPQYWVELFGARDYVPHDFIRPRIWNDDKIPFWYRQNILLFSKRQVSNRVKLNTPDSSLVPLNLVHPELYQNTLSAQTGVKASFKLFRRSLRDYLRGKRLP